MENICQSCGERGSSLSGCLDYCGKCGEIASHRYWKDIAQQTNDKVQMCGGGPSDNEPKCRNEGDEDQKVKKQRRQVSDFKVSNIAGSVAKTGASADERLRKGRVEAAKLRNRAILDVKGQAKPLKTSRKVIDDSMRDGGSSGNEPQRGKNLDENKSVRNRKTFLTGEGTKALRTSRVPGKMGMKMDIAQQTNENEPHDGMPSVIEPQSKKSYDKDMRLRNKQRLVTEPKSLKTSRCPAKTGDDRPSVIESHGKKNCDKDLRLLKQQRLVHEPKPLKTSQVLATDPKSSNVLQQKVIIACVNETDGQKGDKEPNIKTNRRLLRNGEEAEPLEASPVDPTDQT